MTTEKRQTAFIAKVLNGLFTVITVEGRELSATAKGNLRYHKSPLCVGDEIDYILTPQAETAAQIVACRQRKNMLLRPPLANIDELWLVISLFEPEINFLQLDAVICQALQQQIKIRLLLSKVDLDNAEQARSTYISSYFNQAFKTAIISAKMQQLDTITAWCREKELKVALSGLSGVGKSTLLNTLLGSEYMLTQSLSSKLKRGKQTTRHSQFFSCGKIWLADTPGFSALDIAKFRLRPAEAILAYPDLAEFTAECYFNNCSHTHEPKCAVIAACQSPLIRERWQNYCNFYNYIVSEEKKYVY